MHWARIGACGSDKTEQMGAQKKGQGPSREDIMRHCSGVSVYAQGCCFPTCLTSRTCTMQCVPTLRRNRLLVPCHIGECHTVTQRHPCVSNGWTPSQAKMPDLPLQTHPHGSGHIFLRFTIDLSLAHGRHFSLNHPCSRNRREIWQRRLSLEND